MVIRRIIEGHHERRRARARRAEDKKAIAEAHDLGVREGFSKGATVSLIAASIGAGSALLYNNFLRPDEVAPPMPINPDTLNPPPASAPADLETSRPGEELEHVKQAVEAARQKQDGSGSAAKQVAAPQGDGRNIPSVVPFVEVVGTPETPKQKAEREEQYTKNVNAGLLVERSAEKILEDKELAIKRIFEHMLRPQNEMYNAIPSEEGSRITQNEYYKAIEQAFIRKAMGNEAATPAEIKTYWNGLSQAEKNTLIQQIVEARDVGGAFGMQAFNPIQDALNQYLQEHPELNQGQGRGR